MQRDIYRLRLNIGLAVLATSNSVIRRRQAFSRQSMNEVTNLQIAHLLKIKHSR